MVSARHSIARWLTQAGRLVAILYHSISPHQKETEEMPLEPTKHVNGRAVSGNPNGRPVGSRTAFSHGFLKDLAEVWQEHGRDTMLHTAKTQPATFFEAPNECAIYLLRSSLRQTSCWVSAITGGTGPKITGPQHF